MLDPVHKAVKQFCIRSSSFDRCYHRSVVADGVDAVGDTGRELPKEHSRGGMDTKVVEAADGRCGLAACDVPISRHDRYRSEATVSFSIGLGPRGRRMYRSTSPTI